MKNQNKLTGSRSIQPKSLPVRGGAVALAESGPEEPADTCARTPDVWAALTEQEELIEHLCVRLSHLCEKMAPVMRPDCPMSPSPEQEERPTLIGQRLQKHNGNLRGMAESLEQMIDRVEM